MIQSASDFFNYCENHLKDTKSTYCKRRIFRYVEKIDRNNISFKAVPGIRRLHQVVSTKSNNDTPPSKYLMKSIQKNSLEFFVPQK